MYKTNITLNQIERMRLRMIALADKKGFTNEETVVASQELDAIMNEYNAKFVEERLI